MEPITLLWGSIGLLATLLWVYWSDERKRRVLVVRTKLLRARMQDTRKLFSRFRKGKKPKLADDFSAWMDGAQELVWEADCLSGRIGGWRGFLMTAKVTWEVDKLVDVLELHAEKGGELINRAMLEVRVPCRGFYLPVKAVVGQSASKTLEQLELLLQDDEVRRIAVCGSEGVGKTFLMKHLRNSALNWVEKFDHVLWVTLQDQFTVTDVQDAVAAALNCDLTSDDDVNVRANKLSDSLSGPFSFALFLDDVVTDFSFDQVGIPVPGEGNNCKLIVTTSLTMENSLLDHFEAVKVDPLPEEEAYQLFLREANVGQGSDSSLVGIPRLLALSCCGVPHMIVNIATRMRGIDDVREWRHALFKLGLELNTRFHLRCDSSTQVGQ